MINLEAKMRFVFAFLFLINVCLADSKQELKFAEDMFNLAVKIHGVNCNYIDDINEYIDDFKLAFDDPNSYSKDLETLPIQTTLRQNIDEYLKFWSIKSIGNFLLYNKFKSEIMPFEDKSKEYFISKFKLNSDLADKLSSNLVTQMFVLAGGSYYKHYSLNQIERILSVPNLRIDEFVSKIGNKNLTKDELSSILHTALLYNQDESIIKMILLMGADLEDGDESAIFFALKNISKVKFLLKNGANTDKANSFGKTPLFYAVEFNDVELVKLLLENGANPNKKYISKANKDAIVSGLISVPFYRQLCAFEHTGRHIFMHASMYSTPEILELLIAKEANLHAQDDLGYNALDYAIFAKNDENIEFLRNLGLKETKKENDEDSFYYRREFRIW